jgi:hypothetical protein
MTDREDFEDAVKSMGITPRQAMDISMQTDDLYLAPSENAHIADSFIHGTGLFASKDFGVGDFIIVARIDGKRTIAGRFTNHAARPNAVFIPKDGFPPRDIHLMAIYPIQRGQEITIDYRQALAANAELQEALANV